MGAPWPLNRAVTGFPQGGPLGSGDDVPEHQAIKASRDHQVER